MASIALETIDPRAPLARVQNGQMQVSQFCQKGALEGNLLTNLDTEYLRCDRFKSVLTGSMKLAGILLSGNEKKLLSPEFLPLSGRS